MARKGCGRQILRSRAGSYRIGIFFSKPGEKAGDIFINVLRDGYPLDDVTDLTAKLTDIFCRGILQPEASKRRANGKGSKVAARSARKGKAALK